MTIHTFQKTYIPEKWNLCLECMFSPFLGQNLACTYSDRPSHPRSPVCCCFERMVSSKVRQSWGHLAEPLEIQRMRRQLIVVGSQDVVFGGLLQLLSAMDHFFFFCFLHTFTILFWRPFKTWCHPWGRIGMDTFLVGGFCRFWISTRARIVMRKSEHHRKSHPFPLRTNVFSENYVMSEPLQTVYSAYDRKPVKCWLGPEFWRTSISFKWNS